MTKLLIAMDLWGTLAFSFACGGLIAGSIVLVGWLVWGRE